MLSYRLSMLFYELRCVLALAAIYRLLLSTGLFGILLKQTARLLVAARVRLPVELDKIDMCLRLNGSGELELHNLRILSPTRRTPPSPEEGQEGANNDEDAIVIVRRIFISFFTWQSLVAIVASGGTQLVTDNVCIDGLRINIELIDVVEEEEKEEDGESRKEGPRPRPRELKKLLNIWLIANAISGSGSDNGNGNGSADGSVGSDEDSSSSVFEHTSNNSREPEPFNLTWRESHSAAPAFAPNATPDKKKAQPVVIVVSPAMLTSYSLPSLPTVTARVAVATPTSQPKPKPKPKKLENRLSPSSQLDLDPFKLFRSFHESAKDLVEQVQSGTLQNRLSEHVDLLQHQANEFRQEIFHDGLITATSRRVKRSLNNSRHNLEDELRRKLPSTVAELHARVVGPDDPSWTKDIMELDRVWIGGCLLVLDIEIHLRGVLPAVPLVQALESKPLLIPRLVLEGIGACEGGGEGDALIHRHAKGPKLADGWALPYMQRRLEIALIAEATKQNILKTFDDLLAFTNLQQQQELHVQVQEELPRPAVVVEPWNFELT